MFVESEDQTVDTESGQLRIPLVHGPGSPYPGFRYFGIGLRNWRYASPPFQDDYVHYFMKMILWDSLTDPRVAI